jgi:predicted outer membrane repeat protein
VIEEVRVHARIALFSVLPFLLGNRLHTSVAAPMFTVNSPSDAAGDASPGNGICETAPGNGVCTLRAALQESYYTGATINLPAYTITLQGQIYVGAEPTSLVGHGSDLSVVSLQSLAVDGSARIFNLASGAVLTLDGLRLTGSQSIGAASSGAAILGSSGSVTITSCRVDGNRAVIGGGAIWLGAASLTVSDSTFDTNRSGGDGGAIYVSDFGATLSVTGSTFDTNRADGSGGAVRFLGASATVHDSRFLSNTAGFNDPTAPSSGHDGGALWLQTNLDVARSTFTGNRAGLGGAIYGPPISLTGATVVSSTFDANIAQKGGALYVGRELVLTNSTVSANDAYHEGGGIWLAASAVARLFNATLTENVAGWVPSGPIVAPSRGGGLFNSNSTLGSVQITNCLFRHNLEAYESIVGVRTYKPVECAGGVESTGYARLAFNQLPGISNACAAVGTFSTGDVSLGPLQDNGGPTKTQELLDTVVDAGNPGGCTDEFGAVLAIDQRGSKRPVGAACDLGAFERAPHGDANGDGTLDVLDVFFLINVLFAQGPEPVGIANVNGDSQIDVLDVFYLINYLFAGGQAPV